MNSLVETPKQRHERTGRWAKPGHWCNADVAVRATVVTAGSNASGVIVRWTGPAECVLDNGAAGVLTETAARNNKP